MAKLFTIRKYMGDDKYSWAVFDSRSGRPVCTGCNRREAAFHAKKLEDKYNPPVEYKGTYRPGCDPHEGGMN